MLQRTREIHILAAAIWTFAAVGCSPGRDSPDSAVARTDTQTPAAATSNGTELDSAIPVPAQRARRSRPLDPLADTISRSLVFHSRGLRWLTLASRDGRLLVDLGRVDTKLGSPARQAAFRQAVAAASPIPVGMRLRLHGPWGASDATVKGFDAWNGRIVATLDAPSDVVATAKGAAPLVVAASRADSAMPAVMDSCQRDSVPPALASRAGAVRDSISTVLRTGASTIPTRFERSVKVQSSQAIGCFGEASMIVLVTLSAGDYDVVREVAALIYNDGRVLPIRVADTRFRAHEAISAFDADGDGVDDLAVRGRGPRIGETAILTLNLENKRLERLSGGFAWENF